MAASLVLIFGMLGSGYLCRKLGSFSEDAADVLNRFVIYVCAPALILRLVPELALSADLIALAVVPWVITGASFLLVGLAGRALRLDRATQAVLVLSTALGNTSFVGYPMCAALLGEDSVPLAVVYDQFGSFLLLTTVGLVVVARASGAEEPSAREMLRRIVRFPPFVALVLALFVRVGVALWPELAAWAGATILPMILPTLRRVGDALVPVAMFAVGLRTRLTPPAQRSAFAFGLVTKLVAMPLVAWGLATLLGASKEVVNVTVLETAMPPMITAAALAAMAGLAPELSAALVGWGIIVSMLTLRLWAFVLLGR